MLFTLAVVLYVFAILCEVSAAASFLSTLAEHPRQLLEESMDWLDAKYDPEAGYLYDLSAAAALRHDIRNSAWYAVGLLARNRDGDVQQATKIIKNVIRGQFKDPAKQWYGTYQKYPEEPPVGSVSYPPKIYDTWDPNWRGFVSTAFIIGLEEFGHLITPDITRLVQESIYNATVGDSYRVGGVDDDNLYPSYSNPALMRAFASSWTGKMFNDENMTRAGETYAKEIIDLFDRANTLSEFNSGTYTGVSIVALTTWAKYSPDTSIMKTKGVQMLQETWKMVGDLYHPQLKNLAGPWDRGYGFDMNKYFSIIAAHIWCLIGKSAAPVIDKVPMMSHSADFAISPLVAILSPFHDKLVPGTTVGSLQNFQGEHTVDTSAYSIPYDSYPRQITAWLDDNISIGGESFNESVIGGPAINPSQFNPAVIQWNTGNEVGFITLYATEPSINAIARPGSLNITYPLGNSSSTFQLLISPFRKKPEVSTWKDLQGLNIKVSGTIDPKYSVSSSFTDDAINDFMFWNFTYSMPPQSRLVPNILLEVELSGADSTRVS
ncbi:hypothetical protein AJ79_04259 [Helicocarpus griseus UAMH5409]|uniref:Linalool dehydratase/isomerase domain-containing protein n=1 Tax=Helicocarpus griseus UAMH5409 TaxID=1447875 RepID=A0A2B7XU99_9EURO|nr:hypothetical protein AJ79_04259 [Helicocarpus griseus UAMH5409]